jgi:hypothetical protein
VIPVEARWIRCALEELPADRLFPLLNVGSQDEAFRTRGQPWIDAEVFAPLRGRGGKVIHLDLAAGDGVDVAGDLLDPSVRRRLGDTRSVLCANVLEHVPDRGRFAAALEEIVSPGGYLIVTCPRRFPYHADPIDTLFRPDPAELAGLFPSLRLQTSAVVGSAMLDYVLRRVWTLLERGPARKPLTSNSGTRSAFLPWLFRRIEATCVVLRKPAGSS